jgi:hypothetical protein
MGKFSLSFGERRAGIAPVSRQAGATGIQTSLRLFSLSFGETGLEPATSRSQSVHSSQLNYSPVNSCLICSLPIPDLKYFSLSLAAEALAQLSSIIILSKGLCDLVD